MKVRFGVIGVVVSAALLTSCTQAESDPDWSHRRPEPDAPATGPIVADLAIGDTRFELHDAGGGCLAVAVQHPGLQTTVERRCFAGEQVLALTATCGWLAAPEGEPADGCDLELAPVLYGQVRAPGIGFVCVATSREPFGAEGVASARFVPFDPGGFILDAAGAGEHPDAHLFTSGGLRYGQPPLDAPSEPIYRFCEEQAPWGEFDLEYPARLFVDLDPALQTDDLIILLDSGTGPGGLSGGAAQGQETVDFPLRVAASSAGLTVRIEPAGGDPVEFFEEWPGAVRAILDSGGDCRGWLDLRLTITADALAGLDSALTLEYQGSSCG